IVKWIVRFPSIYRLRISWIPIGIVVAVLSRMRELVMKYKAEKVCHEDMVKMPLVDLKVLETSCYHVYRKDLGLHEVKGGARVAFEDESRAAEEREMLCEAQQVVDAWRKKGGVKPRQVRDICKTIQAEISKKIVNLDSYGRRCKDFDYGGSAYDKAEIGESKMIGLEMEQETTKVVVIKERIKEAKDRQERVKLIVGNQTFRI
nr:hypothetical protein [Tanacetum cinerariifolium]